MMMIPFYEHQTELMRGFSQHQLDFPPHLHNCPELVRMRAGQLKVQINTQEHIVDSESLVIIFPNVIHSYQTITPEEDTLIDVLICGQDANNGFPRNLSGCVIENPINPIPFFHPDVDYIFSALIGEIEKPPNPRLIHAYWQILWLRILPQITIAESAQPNVSDLATTLIVYITEHFCEPLSLELLSKKLGVCRFYLSRIFTQVLHIGFYEYVNTLRVDYAKNLLLNSQYSVLDIAMQCGFQSQQTFNRVFKEICGMTPLAYRKRSFAV